MWKKKIIIIIRIRIPLPEIAGFYQENINGGVNFSKTEN